MRTPAFPATGKTPEEQRLWQGLRELVSEMLGAGFLMRAQPGDILRGSVVQLAFGSMNRMLVPTGVAVLPAIRPQNIGVPLYATKLVASGTTQFLGAGGAVVNSVSTGVTRAAIGVQMFWNDGVGWWT